MSDEKQTELLRINGIVKAGYAGTLPNGNIVDRRKHPQAVPIQRNTLLGAPEPLPLDGIELIAQERKRQIEQEGWTPEHDADHTHGELAVAAACYAVEGTDARVTYPDDDPQGSGWPWDAKWWKPGDEVRNLVKAGALIAAEIDRLLSTGEG